MSKCQECGRNECHNGDDCSFHEQGKCWFCHCEQTSEQTCQSFDDCTATETTPCENCGEPTCYDHIDQCDECSNDVCVHCGQTCQNCGDWFCNGHMIYAATFDINYLCPDCYKANEDLVHGDYNDVDGHHHDDDFYNGM